MKKIYGCSFKIWLRTESVFSCHLPGFQPIEVNLLLVFYAINTPYASWQFFVFRFFGCHLNQHAQRFNGGANNIKYVIQLI